MCNHPDPIERLEARQEELMWQWDEAQHDVPEGQYRCPYCSRLFSYEPISVSGALDAPVMCYECLPDDIKQAYDKFLPGGFASR